LAFGICLAAVSVSGILRFLGGFLVFLRD